MDAYLNERQKEILHKVLDNPADSSNAYASNLAELAHMYPQSGLLRALLSRARNEAEPAQAAAIFNGRTLHKLYYHPTDLAEVNSGQLIIHQPKADPIQASPQPENVTVTESAPADLPLEPPAIWNLGQNAAAEPETEEPKLVDYVPQPQPEETPADVAPVPPIEEPVAEQLPEAQTAQALETPAQPVTDIPAPQQEAPTPTVVTDQEEEEEFDLDKYNAELNSLIDILEAENASRAPKVEPAEVTSFTPPLEASQRPQEPGSHIDDEVFDEITPVESFAMPEVTANPLVETVVPELEQPFVSPAEAQAPVDKDHAEATRSYQSSAIGTDYFRFDRTYREPANPPVPVPQEQAAPQQPAPQSTQLTPASIAPAASAATEEQQDVSRYHDEQMPYSFMWWLDKTRKEHAQLYQPFIKAPLAPPAPEGGDAAKVAKRPVDELQQQYFENIFHIASIDDFSQEAVPEPVPFDPEKKEDRIIERFIKEEPHINPPSGDRLDTENKAKRSSEDNDELVTETLAGIYSDQMLYPKAIATYKKLMLKYPEKSAYFASRIEALERKTNS